MSLALTQDWVSKTIKSQAARLRHAFGKADKNGDGGIDLKEVGAPIRPTRPHAHAHAAPRSKCVRH